MGFYKFIEHTADIAIDVSGESLEDLFITAAEAWRKSVLTYENMTFGETKEISLEADSPEELLVGFLNELNYLLLSKNWICSDVTSIEIDFRPGLIKLYSLITGEKFDANKHELRTEIKGVTFHQMKIESNKNVHHTKIIFDI